MTKFDLYDKKDRRKITALPCPYCDSKNLLIFSGSSGYGSRFSDSEFVCMNCKINFPVSPLLRCRTLDECKMKMRLHARMHHDYLKRRIKDQKDQLKAWNKQLLKYHSKKKKYNPSRRTE